MMATSGGTRKKDFARLRDGTDVLQRVGTNGWFHLNSLTGEFSYAVRIAPTLPLAITKGNVAWLETQFARLDPGPKKLYGLWRDRFARAHPEQYNRLINQEPWLRGGM